MKRFLMLLLLPIVPFPAPAHAQDAATEEKINQLSGKIDNLIEAQETLRKRISEISRELDGLRDKADKPTGNYADKEDLKRLGEAIKEVDKKRLEDYDKIHNDLLKLSQTLTKSAGAGPGSKTKSTPVEASGSDKGATTDKGTFEPYVVQQGDTLDAIVQAYKAKNIKITVQQIMKANPGLVPEKMHVGQKII